MALGRECLPRSRKATRYCPIEGRIVRVMNAGLPETFVSCGLLQCSARMSSFQVIGPTVVARFDCV
jgi:hypothetical protein